MQIDWNALSQTLMTTVMAVGLRILGAVVVWIVGRYLIGMAVRMVTRALDRQQLDMTLQRYIGSLLSIALTVLLVVAILGYFGVETTSFAALVAAMGVAIGAAWAGLLSNFAAGVFVVVLRPFKVGDFVSAGGVTGTVDQIGLFATQLLTPDGVPTTVGNAKIFGDTIQNFSAARFRRVDRTAQIAHGVDVTDAIARLKARLARPPHVLASPAPDVDLLDFNPMGAVLAVRPYTDSANCWQVYFDTNRLIAEEFGAAGYPVPSTHAVMRQAQARPGRALAGSSLPVALGLEGAGENDLRVRRGSREKERSRHTAAGFRAANRAGGGARQPVPEAGPGPASRPDRLAAAG